MRPTIRNDSIETCSALFDFIPIDLNKFDCACVGMQSNKLKYFTPLRILSCESSTPLHGTHHVSIYNNQTSSYDTMRVSSLTSLKRKTLGYIDRLSFERCTYLILYDQQKLIRLKNIRGLIQLPTSTIVISRRNYPHENKEKQISKRTMQQAATLLRTILIAVQRDIHGASNYYIFNQFQSLLLHEITSIKETLIKE